MAQIANFIAAIACAVAFWLFVPLSQLFGALPQIVTAMSIVSAALFVRLNRGMPSIDWKSIEPETRKRLTKQMLAITGEYVVILAIAATLMTILVTLQVMTLKTIEATWLAATQKATSACIGCLISLSVVRMSYVVWRDYDIVRTQRTVLDAAADADQLASEQKVADRKIAAIKGSGLRSVPRPDPTSWEE